MIFEQQNQKNFPEKNLGKKILKKNFEFVFQPQVTIPSAHPVHISSRSDYCITLS